MAGYRPMEDFPKHSSIPVPRHTHPDFFGAPDFFHTDGDAVFRDPVQIGGTVHKALMVRVSRAIFNTRVGRALNSSLVMKHRAPAAH